VPQLGATGVAAHEVLKRSGFKVVFGPVRASDLKAFLSAGMAATEDMRTVKFPFFDRLVLTPMEVVAALKPMVIAFGVLFVLNAVGLGHYGRIKLLSTPPNTSALIMISSSNVSMADSMDLVSWI
jgi:hypothetical protein